MSHAEGPKCDLPAEWSWLAELDGYSLLELVSRSSRSRVYGAVRESDGARVLLKAYARDETGDGGSRILRELAVLERVAGVGVPQSLGVVGSAGERALVMERVPGRLLSDWRSEIVPEVASCVQIAAALARVFERIHRAHVIHGDVAPSNLIIDPGSLQVSLIDFGIARPIGSAVHHLELHSALSVRPRDLQFIAPEQAGRMGRGVDTRSDLYSLGATFYFLLTGKSLFPLHDPLAIVHAHMAIEPARPETHRSEIPPRLGDVVMKLLRKEPEQRYASAQLLSLDLEYCQDVLTSGLASDRWVLPSSWRDVRLHVAGSLSGRDAELATLERAFERSRSEGMQWVPVSGPSGMGKSALVRALCRGLTGRVGPVISGKFDSYRESVPYAGFRAAFESLAFQLLSETNARLERRASALREALGPLARVLIDFVSDFGLVMGDVPAVPPLGPRETRSRLSLVIARSLAACASVEQPLILFLDDVQWADAGSRFVLLELLSQLASAPVLLVVTLRDASARADGAHAKFDDWIDECARTRGPAARVELGALTQSAVAELLAESFGSTLDSVDSLADVVHRRTGGSPLLVKEFVEHLYGIGEIHWREGRWSWDLDRVASADVPEGVVGLITSKLHTLEPAVREILELASCIADAFEVQLLAELTERPLEQLEVALKELTEHGILVPAAEGVRFVHDRVREAAQQLSSDATRAALHHRLGISLLDRTAGGDRSARVFEIADHLRRGRACLTPERRDDVLQVLVEAGVVAQSAGAPHTALVYFEEAATLIEPADWEGQQERCYTVLWGAAESAFQSEDPGRAIEWLERLERESWHPLRASRITGLRIIAAWHRDRAGPEHLDAALDAFKRYGIHWPRSPSWWQLRWRLFRTDRALRRHLFDSRLEPRPGGDLSWVPPLWMLAIVAPILMSRNLRLMLIATCDCIHLYLRHGSVHGPAVVLSSYAAYRARVLGDLSQLERFADACVRWLERVDHGRAALRAELVLDAFVLPWIRPRRELVERLDALGERFSEVGESDQVQVCAAYAASLAILSGEPLDRCSARAQRAYRDTGLAAYCYFVGDALELLRDPARLARLDTEVVRIDAAAARWLDAQSYWLPLVHWLLVLAVLGRFALAREVAERTVAVVDEGAVPGPFVADFAFLQAFVHVASPELGPRSRSRARRLLRQRLRQLTRWARHAPDVVPMVSMLHAERARMQGRSGRALAHYARAANQAGSAGITHLAALALERRQQLLQALGDPAAHAAREDAIARYFAWGAMAKREAMRSEAVP